MKTFALAIFLGLLSNTEAVSIKQLSTEDNMDTCPGFDFSENSLV